MKGQKNDKQDVRIIVEASERLTINFVSSKSIPQQDTQSLLLIQEGYIEKIAKKNDVFVYQEVLN